jgi:hypothetical protein
MLLLWEYKKKSLKFILVFDLKAYVYEKLGVRAFLPVARGSGGKHFITDFVNQN